MSPGVRRRVQAYGPGRDHVRQVAQEPRRLVARGHGHTPRIVQHPLAEPVREPAHRLGHRRGDVGIADAVEGHIEGRQARPLLLGRIFDEPQQARVAARGDQVDIRRVAAPGRAEDQHAGLRARGRQDDEVGARIGLVAVAQGRRFVPQGGVDRRQAAMRGAQAGVALQRLVGQDAGFLQAPLLQQDQAQMGLGLGIARLQLKRALEAPLCLFDSPEGELGHGQGRVDVVPVAARHDRLLERRPRTLQLLQRTQDDADRIPGVDSGHGQGHKPHREGLQRTQPAGPGEGGVSLDDPAERPGSCPEQQTGFALGL